MQLCWICRTRPADSGEHRFKASDVRSVAPRISQVTPVFLQRDSKATNDRVGSARADRLKFAKSICTECNNEITQPYDVAWEPPTAQTAKPPPAAPPIRRPKMRVIKGRRLAGW
jgi:hypothetical protein